MKKTLTFILLVGTLALTSISVFAVNQSPVSAGEDIEIVLPQDKSQEEDKETFYNNGYGCSLERCDTYGECGDYDNCLNGPRRDGTGNGMMRGLGNGQGQGRGQGRSCCR